MSGFTNKNSPVTSFFDKMRHVAEVAVAHHYEEPWKRAPAPRTRAARPRD